MRVTDDHSVFSIDFGGRLLLKPKRAFELLDISRSMGYAMIASGELPSIRIGRAVRVPVDGLKEWVRRQTQNNGAEHESA